MIRLKRPFSRYTQVIGLKWRQLGKLCAKFSQVKSGDFFIQELGKCINPAFMFLGRQSNLGHALVGKAVAHNKTGMTRGASQICLLYTSDAADE